MPDSFQFDLLRYHGTDCAGFVLTLISLILLGNGRRGGFAFGAAAAIAWTGFAWLTESVPTLVANLTFCGLNLRGYVRWERSRPGERGGPAPAAPEHAA